MQGQTNVNLYGPWAGERVGSMAFAQQGTMFSVEILQDIAVGPTSLGEGTIQTGQNVLPSPLRPLVELTLPLRCFDTSQGIDYQGSMLLMTNGTIVFRSAPLVPFRANQGVRSQRLVWGGESI